MGAQPDPFGHLEWREDPSGRHPFRCWNSRRKVWTYFVTDEAVEIGSTFRSTDRFWNDDEINYLTGEPRPRSWLNRNAEVIIPWLIGAVVVGGLGAAAFFSIRSANERIENRDPASFDDEYVPPDGLNCLNNPADPAC